MNEQSFKGNKERVHHLQLDGEEIDVGIEEHNRDGRIMLVIIAEWKLFAEQWRRCRLKG